MNKWLRGVLIAVCAVMLLVSGGLLIYKQFEGRAAKRDYDSAAEVAKIADVKQITSAPPTASSGSVPSEDPGAEEPAPEDPELAAWLESMSQMDLAALQQINSEVLSWIAIPDSELNYPVMAHSDNTYYLNHTWLGVRNAAGAIFLDGRCASDMSDFNTIIYGHRMHNNMMFGTLRFYEQQEYWQEHPCVYIFERGSFRCYDIFAAYETGVDSLTYSFGVTEDADKQAFIDYALATSVLDTGVVPTVEDSILTLSTCTQQGGTQTRWVVQAVLRR